MRRLFALAVAILHVLLLALLMFGGRQPVQPEPEATFVSFWPTPIEPAQPLAPAATPPARALPVVSRSLVPLEAPPVAPAPPAASTAITGVTEAPKVNWTSESTLAARRAADRLATEQTTFSAPPKALPKPCVPRKSSMEWNGAEDRSVTWFGPFPVFKIGKRCVVTIGAFACNLGEIPEANSHLLDDMRAPDRPESSVPDPKICD